MIRLRYFRAKEVSTRVRFLFEERWWAATVREATVAAVGRSRGGQLMFSIRAVFMGIAWYILI